MNRYKITVEYDGTPFHGWQRQDGADSIQQRLEESILPITKNPITLYGAGRTDTGVHALAQVAHFDFDTKLDCFKTQECMNALLRDVPIKVLSMEEVSQNFDARFSAKERFYMYKILNRRANACLDLNRVWKISALLDAEKMHKAAQYLVGKHDFSSFRAVGCQSNSPIKTLNSISVIRENNYIFVNVAAKSFLYHQVRNIVGSLYMVGCEKWTISEFLKIFEAKDRTLAGQTAPACGLYFVGVTY